jgi:hypothetical protein
MLSKSYPILCLRTFTIDCIRRTYGANDVYALGNKMKNTTTPSLLILALCGSVYADAWNDSDIFVESVYRQTGATGSVADSLSPFALRASVRNTFSDQTQQLALPTNASFSSNPVTSFQRIGAHHVFWHGASSFFALSQFFGQGQYHWRISGSNSGGLVEPALQSSSFSGIGFQPQIVNGTWNNGRLQLLASNPSFQITKWSTAPTGSQIEFELWRQGGAGGSAMGPSTTTVSWSPQPVGSVFSAYLSFRIPDDSVQVQTPSGGAFNSRYGRASTLYFEIEMVDSLLPPEVVPSVTISSAMQLAWLSHPSKTYQVQRSTNLESWQNFGGIIQGTGEEIHVFDSLAGDKQFYRVIITAGVAANLSILQASYGGDNVFADVRSYIEESVQNNTVEIEVGNHTLGGDPVSGVYKSLFVRYQNALGMYEATVWEGETLRIPDATHTKIQ